jgi:hypothetical protein
MLSFEEDFFARALTKTMRRYMRAVPTRVGLECTEDSVILKITYVDTQNVRYLTELSRLYLLSKCDYNVNSYDGHTDITLALKTDRIKNLRVYADNKDRLHAALINAFECANDRL